MKEEMPNRIKDARKFNISTSEFTVESWLAFFVNNRLDLSPYYQRDYVWGAVEQQAFLLSVVRGAPLSAIAAVKDEKSAKTVYEIVDGKQRLTTLKLFFENEIALRLNGEEIFYKDFNMAEENAFGNVSLPMIRLHNASEKDKLMYFLSVNFTGVPQSEEHRLKVLELFGAESLKSF